MRISDWSSDVCSSDLAGGGAGGNRRAAHAAIFEINVDFHGGITAAVQNFSGDDICDGSHESLPAFRWGLRVALSDRKSVVWGKSVSVRVDLGGRRIIKKKNINE